MASCRIRGAGFTKGRTLKEKDLREGLVVWAVLQLFEERRPKINGAYTLRKHPNSEEHPTWMLDGADYDFEETGDPNDICYIEFPEGELTLYEAEEQPD